jgi:phosphoribosylglycinamide formyltransferase 1
MAVTLSRPLKVAVLCSHRAPGLVHLLNHDRHRGSSYDIVCCLTSSDTFAEEVRVERRGIPTLSHPIRAFCRKRGARLGDLGARAAYDEETVRFLEPFSPDLLLLDGYLLLLTRPCLDRFDGRIINIHHSDLLQRTPDGGVRYPGLRAVRDALLAGERETRATAHVVTERLDEGPVLLRSWPFPVPEVMRDALQQGAEDALRRYIPAHQEWMLRTAFGPMLAAALELACAAFAGPRRRLNLQAAGRWTLTRDGRLSRDHVPEEMVMA